MKWFVAAALVGGCVLGWEHPLFAWSFTVDVPQQYTFDHAVPNQVPAGSSNQPAPFRDRSTTQVSGYKATLIAPFHVGIGYEDYSVDQTVYPGICTPCSANFHLAFQILDVLVDIPMRWLNLGLGYGMGTAYARIDLPAGAPPNSIQPADVSQYFVTLGFPLGRFDLHVAYHVVSVQEVDSVTGSPPFDKLQLGGTMLSAGARLNF